MTNHEIAATFDEIADLLEFQGANPFRVRAYRNAARTIHDLPESAAPRSRPIPSRSLTDIEGIGKDLAEKVAALVETGSLPMLEELLRRGAGKRAGDPPRARAWAEAGGATLPAIERRHARRTPRRPARRTASTSSRASARRPRRPFCRASTSPPRPQQRILWIEADQHVQEILPTCALPGGRADRRRRQLPAGQGDGRRPGFPGRHPRRRRRDGPPGRVRRRGLGRSPAARRKCRSASRPACRSICARCRPNRSARPCNTSPARRSTTSSSAAGPRTAGSRSTNTACSAATSGSPAAPRKRSTRRLDLPCFPPELREARREFEWADAGSCPS